MLCGNVWYVFVLYCMVEWCMVWYGIELCCVCLINGAYCVVWHDIVECSIVVVPYSMV